LFFLAIVNAVWTYPPPLLHRRSSLPLPPFPVHPRRPTPPPSPNRSFPVPPRRPFTSRAQRKKRAIPAETASREAVAKLAPGASFQPHAPSGPAGIGAIAVHAAARRATHVATGGADKTALIFDVGARRVLGRLPGHGKRVTGVAFHPDAATDALVTASADSVVRLWVPLKAEEGAVAAAAGRVGEAAE
jgi:WD40 repeat protein